MERLLTDAVADMAAYEFRTGTGPPPTRDRQGEKFGGIERMADEDTEVKDAVEGTADRKFHDAVLQAEAEPRTRALGIIWREMENRPDLAWKFIERQEPGFAPPQATPPAQPQQVRHRALVAWWSPDPCSRTRRRGDRCPERSNRLAP